MANPSGKSKYTKAQRLAYARQALDSGLTQTKFAEQEGIPKSSISNWIAQYKKTIVGGQEDESVIAPAYDADDGGDTRSELEETIVERGREIVRLQEANGRLMADLEGVKKTRDMHAETVQGLKQALEDERVKVKSLMNVVVILGHQVGDE